MTSPVLTSRLMLVVVVVLFVLSLWAPPSAWGDVVVRPEVVTVLLAVVLVAVLVLRRALRSDGASAVARWLVMALAVPVVGLVAAGRVLLGLGTSYVVLEPEGPSGCRVVVEESSFLMLGSGRVGTVGPLGLMYLQSDYTADDGGQPASTGSAKVTWDGDEATVELTGAPGQPVWPALHEVVC